MRVLISGGLGFLGRAATKRLRLGNHMVRLMDRRDPGEADTDVVHGDVLDMDACRSACEGIDVVVHAAAIHHAVQVAQDPQEATKTNVQGTLNLFQSARDGGARRFVFLSSAKVYGNPDHCPSAEDAPLHPEDHYAHSKAHCEKYLCDNIDGSGMDLVIIRPFSVYGPGQPLDTGYVGMVLQALLFNRHVALPGLSIFRRDFVHIDDVTFLSVSAMLADSLPQVTIVNAGSGVSVSLGDLTALASDLAGRDLPISLRNPSPDTLKQTHACLNRSIELFGYQPRYNIRTGLVDTFEWFKSAHYEAQRQSGS